MKELTELPSIIYITAPTFWGGLSNTCYNEYKITMCIPIKSIGMEIKKPLPISELIHDFEGLVTAARFSEESGINCCIYDIIFPEYEAAFYFHQSILLELT